MPYEEIRPQKQLRVRRYDGAPVGANVPKYQVQGTGVFTPSDHAAPDSKIYITDFGEAFFDQLSSGASLPTRLNTPTLVRPLEAIFGCPITFAADIWTLGLTIYEIIGREALFESYFPSEDTVLQEAVKTLGPLPAKWWQAWPNRSQFFIDDKISADLKNRLYRSVGRDTHSAAYGFDEFEMGIFEELLRSMLKYQPQDRVTVDKALQSEWVRRYGIPALKECVLDIDLSSLEVPQDVREKM